MTIYDFIIKDIDGNNFSLGFLGTKRIKWNFTKFLIDEEGKALKRYSPTIKPEIIETDIKKLLGI